MRHLLYHIESSIGKDYAWKALKSQIGKIQQQIAGSRSPCPWEHDEILTAFLLLFYLDFKKKIWSKLTVVSYPVDYLTNGLLDRPSACSVAAMLACSISSGVNVFKPAANCSLVPIYHPSRFLISHLLLVFLE